MSKLYTLLNTLISKLNTCIKTTTQTLTSTQKSQARANIGAMADTYTAPVTSVNGKTGAVTVDVPTVPTKVSAFTNDAGYITGYTETDPTVPSWAKAASKPSYTASEVGAVPTSRTVNGKKLSSNITLTASEIGAVSNESTLTLVGVDADGGTHTYTIYGKSAANEPD